MHTATVREEVSAPALTITEGLAQHVQAFASRDVTVARATLKRQKQTYEYTVDDKQPGIQRHIEGRFTNILIVVSCLSPMSAKLNAELQAITTTATTAAQHRTEPVNRPTLVKPSATDRQMIGASAENEGTRCRHQPRRSLQPRGTDHRRIRNRQNYRRRFDSSEKSESHQTLRRYQLRRFAGNPDRKRIVRLRKGSLHRRCRDQERTLRTCRRRNPVS